MRSGSVSYRVFNVILNPETSRATVILSAGEDAATRDYVTVSLSHTVCVGTAERQHDHAVNAVRIALQAALSALNGEAAAA